MVLEDDGAASLPPFIEADREQAVADLAAANHFASLASGGHGEPRVPMSCISPSATAGWCSTFATADDAPLIAIGLALGPFRRLMKDYQMLVDSHIKAVEEGREARIQAIDMGRRGLHNEGAELMTRTPGRQDRHRFRHRAPAVHPGLRAGSNGRAALMKAVAMKVDGVAYRSVWLDRDGWLVGAHHRPDEIAVVVGDPAPD